MVDMVWRAERVVLYSPLPSEQRRRITVLDNVRLTWNQFTVEVKHAFYYRFFY